MRENSAIALIDCNNFFVSCERAVNPQLQNRPVVVLSNNDGCIISRSDEVRKLGVPMAAPYFQVKELLEKNDTAVISSNHALYCEISNSVMNILREYLGDNSLEIYSVDEAFVDVGVADKLNGLGTHIRKKILEETKIPVSVGMAETKTLAKVANKIARKSEKACGVLDLFKSPYIDLALKKTEVKDIWGVGHRTASYLKENGVNTAFDLKCIDPETVRHRLKVFGARTILELRGVKCLPLDITFKDKKSIAYTRTFGHTTSSYLDVKNAIIYFTTRALEKMRRDNLTTKSITVFLKTDRYNPKPYYYSNTATFDSVYHSAATGEIYGWAIECFEKIFRPDLHYKRAGVILGGLLSDKLISQRLYEQKLFERWHRINKLVDEVNLTYGRDMLHFARLNQLGIWQQNSDFNGNDENHSISRDRLGLGVNLSNFRFI